MKSMRMLFVAVLAAAVVLTACGGGSSSGGGGGATTQTATSNPVFDFYINRTWNTDTNTLMGYGADVVGNFTTDATGSETGTIAGPPPINYHNFFKLLYNFDISALNGATIQSAYFRIYLHSIGGTDMPQNAMLENIFYGNTSGFPVLRNYGDEFGGYTVTPVITDTAVASAIGWKSFDVTAKLQADVNAGRSNAQFRLSHVNATNLLNYNCNWYMTDNASNKPELVVTYSK